jgi:hypothetical protein
MMYIFERKIKEVYTFGVSVLVLIYLHVYILTF